VALDDYRERVGSLIRQAREARGWSQHELALRMRSDSVTGNLVSRWERGAQMPSPAYFAAVERAFGCQLIPEQLPEECVSGSLKSGATVEPTSDVDLAIVRPLPGLRVTGNRRAHDRRTSSI
jgi:ribosome-binding protein aMBF1 (putative translation factor)